MARYRKRPCPRCGQMVTTNALGRAAHQRSAQCESPFEKAERARAAWRQRCAERAAAEATPTTPTDGETK